MSTGSDQEPLDDPSATRQPVEPTTLLSVIQDAVIVTDPTLRITGWNPAAEALYGWSAVEALGQLAHDLLQTDYLDRERPQLLQELQDRGVWKGEVVHRHHDGHPIAVLATVTWLRGSAGEPLGILSVNRDISERKAAEAQLRASTTRLKVLADTSRVFAEAGTDLAGVLARIVEATTDILGDGCAISLVSDDGRWLERVAVYSIDPQRLHLLREHNEHPQPLDSPFAGPRIVRTGQPLLLPVVDHERFLASVRPESRALWDQLAFHSMLGVPMRVQGRTIGILTLFRHRPEQQPFSEDDLALAQDLADRAALAILNARLFQQVQNELTERQRTEQALRMSEAKLRAVFNALVEGVVFLNPQGEVEEANAAIQRFHGHTLGELADPETDPRSKILRADGSLFPEDAQPAMVALRTNQPVRDVEMGVPAGDGSFRWRIVNAQPVTDTEGTLLGAVASFFDITERRRAEQERLRSAERLQILAEASRLFAEAGSEYDTVLSQVARTLVVLLGDGCIVALISDDGAWLEASHVYDVDPDVQELTRSLLGGQRRIEESTTNARVFQTGQPLLVPVVDRDQLRAAAKPAYAAMIERQGYHSLMVVPMRAFGRVISVLTLYRRQSERLPFSAEDLSLAQDLADRAALAISNARLFQQIQVELAERERAQKVTELLYQASQLLARPLGQDEVLNTLLDVLQQLIPYDSANIMLPVPDGLDVFRVRYLRGYETWTDPDVVKALTFDPAQRTPLAQIIATRRSLLIADTHQEPGWDPMMGTRYIGCWLGVPLIANDTLVGIFSIDRHQPHSLTANDVRLAETLAVSAATAIERAQLLAELRDERAQLARRVAERTADLSLANAELARAARLKDEFLANMSHELRTPLNSILGRSEALEEAIYGPVTPAQVTALQGIRESGQHLLTLINDILDLSKIESGRLTLERETLDVNLVGTMALRMIAQIALAKRITLTSNFDAQVQLIAADERRLKQILVNLLSNAVKFTPEGGQVGLEVRGDPEQQTATFTVWDTGIGIAAEDLPRLFQPFVQLDSSLNREHAGTGLGLSLVSRLTQAQGGSVGVVSTPGQGSRFSVTLPWFPEDQNIDRKGPPATVDRSTPALATALVVEDSSTAAAQVTRYLRELGARVEVHPQGTGTVERAIALQPDVIILDILLPDADGWEVLRQLKAEPRTQAIPVVVISVVDEPERARTLGAAALLTKPIDRPGLVQVLRAVTGRRGEPPVQMTLVVARTTRRPRILLADDNEATIDTTSDYLHAKGYEVIVARNGREAIVHAQEERPEVILMDIQMPGMDGLEAIRRLRAEPGMGQVPILAVTALAMPGDRERCLAAGADEYLAKPVNLRTLVAMIETYRRRGDGQANDART